MTLCKQVPYASTKGALGAHCRVILALQICYLLAMEHQATVRGYAHCASWRSFATQYLSIVRSGACRVAGAHANNRPERDMASGRTSGLRKRIVREDHVRGKQATWCVLVGGWGCMVSEPGSKAGPHPAGHVSENLSVGINCHERGQNNTICGLASHLHLSLCYRWAQGQETNDCVGLMAFVTRTQQAWGIRWRVPALRDEC